MMRELNKIEKIEVFNTYSNFILIKFDTKEDPYDMLLERGFYLRKCLDFNGLGSKFLRTSIKRHEENMELIEVLRDILK